MRVEWNAYDTSHLSKHSREAGNKRRAKEYKSHDEVSPETVLLVYTNLSVMD